MTKIPPPPKGLKAAGRRFWKGVHSQLEIMESHNLEKMRLAANCLDEISEDENIIKRDGRFFTDRYGGMKEHPAGKAIRENRVIFCRICRELGLDLEGVVESRPPRQY